MGERTSGPLVRFLSRHRLPLALGGLLVVASGIFWFQPHKLFLEEEVDEALPMVQLGGAESDGEEERASEPEAAPPQTLLEGEFRRLEHPTSGTAKVIELSDGRRYLRFDGLDTSNGPDLRVYLSEIPASDDWFAYGERFVDLGGLKGNRGNQNYEIPNDVDLDRYVSAVIWCRRFTVGFGVAPLDQV